MKIDVSFIVPVFNTSIDQLSRCLKSIKEQKNITFEIIVVNDGSTKISSDRYEQLVCRYNAKYIYQKNQGVSIARNTGIKEAKGKYINFVDSDDELVSNSIIKEDIDENIDFLIYNVKKINENIHSNKIYSLATLKYPKKKQIIEGFLDNDMLNWSVGKLYKREFLINNSISFDRNRISGEDFVFVYTFFSHNPKIKYIPKVIYNYFYNDETGKNRILSNPVGNINDIMTLYRIRMKIIREYRGFNNYGRSLCEGTITDLFNNYTVIVENRKKMVKEIHPKYIEAIDGLNKKDVKQSKIKYKLKILLMKHRKYILTKIYNDVFHLKILIGKLIK